MNLSFLLSLLLSPFFPLLLISTSSAAQPRYSAVVLEHPATSTGASLISMVNGSSDFRYNLNSGYLPLPNAEAEAEGGTEGLVLRVCNCSWGHAGHTPASQQPGCAQPFASAGASSWGATAITVRSPTDPASYGHVSAASIILDGAVDPRIVYRPKDKTYYLTADSQPYCTHLWTSKTPLNRSSWQPRGPVVATDQCKTIKGGASLLVREDNGTHFAILATSDTSAALRYATSTDMVTWTDRGFFQRGRPGMWDAHGMAAGPPPQQLTTGDYVYFYNTDAGVGSGDKPPYHRCQVGWLVMDRDDPSKVIARGAAPLLSPLAPWELGLAADYNTNGVIFADGAKPLGNDEFLIFYGGSDTVVGASKVKVVVTS